jgi:hypothetical protein
MPVSGAVAGSVVETGESCGFWPSRRHSLQTLPNVHQSIRNIHGRGQAVCVMGWLAACVFAILDVVLRCTTQLEV